VAERLDHRRRLVRQRRHGAVDDPCGGGCDDRFLPPSVADSCFSAPTAFRYDVT
jgi:hypothetical protein